MAAWVCATCTTVYHVDAPRCPHCGAVEYYEQGAEPMPKNTRLSGMSHAAAGIGPDPIGESGPELVDLPPGVSVVASDPTGPVDEPETGDGTDTADDGQDAADGHDGAPGGDPARPAINATREAWAAYAQTAHGIDPTGLTRNQLIDAVIDAEAVHE